MDMMMLAEGMSVIDNLGNGIGGVAIGCGLTAIGGGVGIGRLCASALESIARQPEMHGRIFTTMIVSAALIEGFTLFALVLCMIGMGNIKHFAELVTGQG